MKHRLDLQNPIMAIPVKAVVSHSALVSKLTVPAYDACQVLKRTLNSRGFLVRAFRPPNH